MKYNWVISLSIFILLISMTFFIFGNRSKNSIGLPSYALINDKIKEGYLFATENPDALNGVNCFCGCMKTVHNGRIHNRGLLDCFKKENNDYDSHAANCDMCITEALEVRKLTGKNKTKEEIKNYIDSKYDKNLIKLAY